MKILIAKQPNPPAGYTMFAHHAGSDWQMWVPPTTATRAQRIQKFQFRNPTAGFIVTSDGGAPWISVGSNADVYDDDGQVFCSDIVNNYDRTSRERPRLPRFVALWVAYLCKIKADISAHEVKIHNVANAELREYAVRLGMAAETTTEFVGQLADIETVVVLECTTAGWTFS
jgi:hypothetical protein